MKDRLIGSVPTIIIGFLIAIAPRTFAPICEFAHHSHDHGEHMGEHMGGHMGEHMSEHMGQGSHGGGSGMSVAVIEGMMPMHMPCYWTAQASLGIGLVLMVIGITAFMVNNQIRIGLNLAAGLTYVLELLIVTVLIGTCGDPEMSCNVLTQPTLIGLSAVGILALCAAMFIDWKASPRATPSATPGDTLEAPGVEKDPVQPD